ncbi:MAG: tetratricopeptide repeat protein [Planctomycetota bacterium]|jgi:hypothetical protein
MPSSRPINFASIAAVLLGMVTGCQMTAPIHVWKPPTVVQPGPVRVAISPIAGEPDVAQQLQQALELSRPQSMSQLAVILPNELERLGGIQLAAYDGQPSEMASLGAARQAGANYLLAGHVISHRLTAPPPRPKRPSLFSFVRKSPTSENLSVRWIVYDVESGQRLGEQTLTTTRRDVDKQFPDLAFQSDGGAKVMAASARRSWELVVPTTRATDVLLDLPWFAPGSSAVRKGNAYARLGQWETAERTWQDAADAHNWNTAAWKNLAIAAVAREDFTLARSRLQHADWKYWPGDSSRGTLEWIEKQQRQYHEAFRLPDPEGGWSFTAPSREVVPASFETTLGPNDPVSLDDQPWYTAVPFLPPPGWSWTQWWSQPWVW